MSTYLLVVLERVALYAGLEPAQLSWQPVSVQLVPEQHFLLSLAVECVSLSTQALVSFPYIEEVNWHHVMQTCVHANGCDDASCLVTACH